MGTESQEKSENGHIEHVEDKPKADANEEESQLEHVPYPKSVFFIISNEFCERFSYYGMRTILSLYLRDILLFSESDSTVIYHVFTMFAYFFPILGAIISDSWWGKFRTILYVSIIYACGNILLAISSVSEWNIPQVPFSLLALFLIAVGTGGIKPCVSAFGGDQFVLPQQELQLAAFFSVFYFSINAGSLISTFLTPVLREDVHCFHENSCYPLAFAVPGVLMIVSIVIFFLGMGMYKIRKPEGNVVVKVCKCIWYAAMKNRKAEEKKEHWLDHSEDKYGKKLVDDVKVTLKVLIVYVPLPIFWALYDQQGSKWTFQAARMDGKIGSWTILPDQMQVINPILIMVFIPLFTYILYPFFARFYFLTTPLQRMVYGGFIAAIAFGVSAGISFALEATYPNLPTDGSTQIRIYNPYTCQATFHIENQAGKNDIIPLMGHKELYIDMNGVMDLDYTFNAPCAPNVNSTGTIKVSEAVGYVVYPSDLGVVQLEDDISKPEDGLPKLRTLVSNPHEESYIQYYDGLDAALNFSSFNNSFQIIDPGTYKLGNQEYTFDLGGVYTVLVHLNGEKIDKSINIQITEPNSVHILWQIPQYVIVTAAEILFSITGLEFSYSQAPVEMKSVMTAMFLLTSAVGNIIIVIIESAKIFDKESYDFLLYTGLMVADMLIFTWIASRYKYMKTPATEEDKDKDDSIEPDKELSEKPPLENNNRY